MRSSIKEKIQTSFVKWITRLFTKEKGRNYVWRLPIIAFVLEAIAFVADCYPGNYICNWFESVFEYDRLEVIPVVAIIWGAASLPIGFLLAQSERRCYGIRLIDLLIAGWGKLKVMILLLLVCMQLFLVLFMAFYNRFPILFFAVAWTQVLYVFIAFYLVALSLSYETNYNIIKTQCIKISNYLKDESDKINKQLVGISIHGSEETIKEYLKEFSEKKKTQHWLWEDMIKNVDYNKKEELDNLIRMLREGMFGQVQGVLGRKLVFDLFITMFDIADSKTVHSIIYDIFFEENGTDVRKGIIYALISERDIISYNFFWLLVERIDDFNGINSEKDNLVFYGLLWATHQQMYYLDDSEQVENQYFIYCLRNYLRTKSSKECIWSRFNELIWESCLDVQFLLGMDNLNKTLENLLQNKLI